MLELAPYFFAALAWIGLAILIGFYIHVKRKGLGWQVKAGLLAMGISYALGLILLFTGILSI